MRYVCLASIPCWSLVVGRLSFVVGRWIVGVEWDWNWEIHGAFANGSWSDRNE